MIRNDYPLDIPSGLEDRLVFAVNRHRKRRRAIRLAGYSALSAASAAGMIPAVSGLVTGLSQSGFLRYLSLAFSDGSAVWSMGRDFSLLLAESIPFTSVAASLVLIAILAWSVGKITKRAPVAPAPYAMA